MMQAMGPVTIYTEGQGGFEKRSDAAAASLRWRSASLDLDFLLLFDGLCCLRQGYRQDAVFE